MDDPSSGRYGGQRSKEVAMTLIDHSDVYFENERLGEELLRSVECIQRNGYKKQKTRDLEIKALKKSLQSMRTQSSKDGKRFKIRKLLKSANEIQSSNDRFQPVDFIDDHNCAEPQSTVSGNFSGVDCCFRGSGGGGCDGGVAEERNVAERPTKERIATIIEKHLPQVVGEIECDKSTDKVDDGGDAIGDESADTDNPDDDDDDDDDGDDDDGSNNNDNENKNYNGYNKEISAYSTHEKESRALKADKSTRTSVPYEKGQTRVPIAKKFTNGSLRPATCLPTRGRNRYDNGTSKTSNGLLQSLMTRLDKGQLPPSWYTDVLPATDVHVIRRTRGRQAAAYGRLGEGSNCSQGRRQSIRTSASASGDYLYDDKNLKSRLDHPATTSEIHRPFTALGVTSVRNIGESGSSHRSTPGNESDTDGSSDNRHKGVSSLVCGRKTVSKTMRQLKEEAANTSLLGGQSTVDVLLEEVREERKLIDSKVKSFVKSLDDVKKSERLKIVMYRSVLQFS